ncbi:YiiX/YebB-like N1pC/P60 family cysteine hydrolase [Rufibacter radiotolerans]|uniref:YiiX/YebB-like N1pC/P60 family cysteine hydrolase n=1 Tax=Rufibacter radiotolerans TaxID=1379910 RepID=UPI000B009FA4|nr:YiiX/YebB-like N1pC/P60 family cysteine hydrolase [Rufibacter radiotolerans]
MLRTRYILLLLFLVPLLVAGFFLEKRYGKPNQLHQSQQLRQLIQKGEFQDGDLIFHTSRSAQSKAIQLATKSAYSHCGIIYKTAGGYQVFEAVQPVSSTPLDKWVARGEGGHFVVKRLKNAKQVLTPSALARLKKEGGSLRARDTTCTLNGQMTKSTAQN